MKSIEIYNRCLSGKPFNRQLKLYSKELLIKVLKELEILEEYEKCHYLNEYIKERFNHNKNYGRNLLNGEKAIQL